MLVTVMASLYPIAMVIEMPLADSEPPRDCKRCPRLVKLRREMQLQYPDWWNAPVPTWGDVDAWLAIIGLAPGLKGANRTGRPFTGDAAGDLLFSTLAKTGFSIGQFGNHAADGLRLDGAVILNSVKCLPPQNKPTLREVNNCRSYLTKKMGRLPKLRIFIALGKIAHDSFIRHLGLRLSDYPFAHGAEHMIGGGHVLIDSYHCSRYNVQTKRLTTSMFEDVFRQAIARNRHP